MINSWMDIWIESKRKIRVLNNDPSRNMSNKSFTAKFKAVYDLVRPELPLAGGICVIAGQIIVLQTLPTFFVGIMGFLSGFFISGAAMMTNDYFDQDVDRINHPQRPLPSGRISLVEVKILTGIFSAIGFITAALLGPIALILALFLWIIAILYNWKLKESGLLGNMMVGLSVAGFFIFGGLTVDGLTNGLIWTFGTLAFLFDIGEEIAGDAMDMEGDETWLQNISTTTWKKMCPEYIKCTIHIICPYKSSSSNNGLA